MKISLIIAAAGSGERMNSNISKVLLPLHGKPLLLRSLELFCDCQEVKEIIIAANKKDIEEIKTLTSNYAKIKAIVEGGGCRPLSIGKALAQTADDCSHIAVHDAARPLLTRSDWQALLAQANQAPAGVIMAAPVVDSIRAHADGKITAMLERESLLLAETPQIFPAPLLRQAYAELDPTIIAQATDEAQLIASLGKQTAFVYSQDANFKITRPEDLLKAAAILTAREGEKTLRYGLGYDSHRLVAGRKLILGGIEIPHSKGLLGHSDADVLIHAIIDACLGAAALGDIGRHFPDDDPAYQDIASSKLLLLTREMLEQQGAEIMHIDATLIAEQPHFAPYNDQIAANIAKLLGLNKEQVAIKAKTNEGLGDIGNEEAMAALAIATLRG